jgi:hypothetical protein
MMSFLPIHQMHDGRSRIETVLVDDGHPGPHGGDVQAMDFWFDDPPNWIAAGDTPQAALDNLRIKFGVTDDDPAD